MVKNKRLLKIKILNFFIAFIPLSIILGNSIINLNIILICILGLIIFKKNLFKFEKDNLKYLLIFFFFYILIVTSINNIPNFYKEDLYKTNFIKSIFFFRFLLLFLVINKLIEEKKFNFKLFFISSAFFSASLSIDILIQVIFGKDLLGNPIILSKASGFFGSELIAGGYLQKFSLFCIFLVTIYFKKMKSKIPASLIMFLIFLIPITLSGNRMSALIFMISGITYFLINKKFKEILIVFIFFLIVIIALIKFPIIKRIDTQIKNFSSETIKIIKHAPNLFYNDLYHNDEINFTSGYLIYFNSGIKAWKKNKFFGNGLKSLQLNCKFAKYQTCGNHPHNYFIEIMSDFGIFGIIIIYILFIKSIINFFKYYFKITKGNLKLVSMPFFLVIFFEFFPLRSTGSFFTTNNAIIIFLFLAIFLNLDKLKSIK